ncbi:TonB-dependent receptor domain-containing protein [Lutibacter sp.]
MNNKTVFASLVLVFVVALSYAQEITIVGKVIDNITKEPIFGATILIENTQRGTTTNELGEFTLKNIKTSDYILVSFIGYKHQKIKANQKKYVIFLKSEENRLEEVVVSASRTQQRRQDVPVAISTVSAETLDVIKPSSLDQVLNQTPGVLMVDLGNEQHMMAIRQPISTKSLFLYLEDGIPIRPTGVFNHNALLELNMAAINNIEIIRGPYSSLYGSEAIGGAINFFTANPTAMPTGSFSIRGNDQGYLRMDAKVTTTVGKTGIYVSGYKSQIKDGIRAYGDYDKDAITFKLTHQFSDKTSLSNTLTYIKYFSEMSGSLDETKFINKDYTSYHTFTYRDSRALRFNSTLKHVWNEKNNTSLTLIYRDNSMKQNPSYRIDNDAAFDSYTPGQVNDNSFNSYGFVAQHNINFSKGKLSIGSSLDYSPNTYEALETSVYRNIDGMYESYSLTGNYLSNYAVDLFNIGGYLSGEYQVSDNFKLSAGLRVDQFNYDFVNRLGVDASDYKAPNTKSTFSAVTPRLGAIYKVNNQIGTYANYSNGFLPPSVGELYRKTDVPLLDPSKFNNYEVGSWLKLFNNKLYVDVAAYYLRGKDEVTSVTVQDGAVRIRENRNVGETEHYGVEYLLKLKPVTNLSLRFSGSYSKHYYIDFVTKIVDGEATTDYSGNEMKGAPDWVNNAEIKYTPSAIKGLRVSVEWQHVGSYFTDDANTTTYEGYDVFNTRVGYKKGHWNLWVNMLNIADKLYATKASTDWGSTTYTPGNPRTFNLGLEINLF